MVSMTKPGPLNSEENPRRAGGLWGPERWVCLLRQAKCAWRQGHPKGKEGWRSRACLLNFKMFWRLFVGGKEKAQERRGRERKLKGYIASTFSQSYLFNNFLFSITIVKTMTKNLKESMCIAKRIKRGIFDLSFIPTQEKCKKDCKPKS